MEEFKHKHSIIDADEVRLHILDCIGTLASYEADALKKKSASPTIFDELEKSKRRVFWQTISEIGSQLQKEKFTNERLNIVFESVISEEEEPSVLKSWLPTHFSLAIDNADPADISLIFLDGQENITVECGDKKWNPAHILATSPNPDLKVLHELHEYFPDFAKSITNDGETPLHLACAYSNCVDMVRELIRYYPDALRIVSRKGITPLCSIAKNHSPAALDILKLLLEEDPTLAGMVSDCCGGVPINLFISQGGPWITEVVKLMIDAYRPALYHRDRCGRLSIHIASMFSSVDVMKILLGEMQMTPQRLLEEGSDHSGGTIAHWAVVHDSSRYERLELLEFLNHAYPSLLLHPDLTGCTPLHMAARYKESKMVKAVYEMSPAAVEMVDRKKQTVLHYLALSADWDGDSPLLLSNPMSDRAESLRFLLRVYPQAARMRDASGRLPSDILGSTYARRLLLLAAKDVDPITLAELTFAERRGGLLAFHGITRGYNICQRILHGREGRALMRYILCFL